ncbi:MAG: response regulator [Ignavibacteriae bacterium]|nr:response regulator [Ignavibacteriota bacterium]
MKVKQKILIVDDKLPNLVALENVLKDCGAEVVRAQSGNEALKTTLTNDFALAILDVNMPEMNGYELAEFLSGDEKTKNLPIIFLSAEYSDDMHILKAYESGGIDFVSKPFNPYYLLSKVNIFLKLDRQKKELIDKMQIEKSKNYLESILMSVNDFIVVTTLDGIINNFNNVLLSKLDYDYNDLFRAKVTDIFPVDIKHIIETLLIRYSEEEVGSGLLDFKFETFIHKKEKSTIPVIISITPLVNENGSIQGAVITATDITERKKFELELRKEKERAEQLSQIKTNFLANMSHELRTPMVGILGFSELLTSMVEDGEQKEFADMIYLSGTRLMETLNQILDISLVESDKLELKITEFDVVALTKEVIQLFELVANKKSLYLNIDSSLDSCIVKLDMGLTRQVLNNLINNAVKFTKEGGVRVNVLKELSGNIDYAVIKVTDTGIGIPEDKVDLIWEEFRQVSEGHGRSFEGNGLGLSLCKKFVDLLGGILSIEESVLGKGTTFKVMLPLNKDFMVPDIPEVILSKKLTTEKNVVPEIDNGLNVLYVEDDLPSGILMKNSLKNICKLDIVTTGEEAIDVARKKKYSLILMDINLGDGINGATACGEIKLIDGYRNVPIVAITAFAMVGDKEKFLEKGFDNYMSKPFVNLDLPEFVKGLLIQ